MTATLRPADCAAILRSARRLEADRLAARMEAIADECEQAPLAEGESPRQAASVVRYLRSLARIGRERRARQG